MDQRYHIKDHRPALLRLFCSKIKSLLPFNPVLAKKKIYPGKRGGLDKNCMLTRQNSHCKLFIEDLRTKLVVIAEVVVPMITSARQHQTELDFCINGHLPAVDSK